MKKSREHIYAVVYIRFTVRMLPQCFLSVQSISSNCRGRISYLFRLILLLHLWLTPATTYGR